MTGDVAFAEDLASEAVVAALKQWPAEGVPKNPGAWLTAVGKRRAIDTWRRDERRQERYAQLALAQTAGLSGEREDRKSTRLNSSHVAISYAVFCLKKKKDYKSNDILRYCIQHVWG